MAYKQFYINGTGTGEFGIYISSDTYLNAPKIDYTEYTVPGRSGALIAGGDRLNNIIRKFTCHIQNSAAANFDAFKKLIYTNTGYMEISSDYEPEVYQLGYLAEELTAVPFLPGDLLNIDFEIYFSCKPQKFYKTNQTTTMTPPSTQGYTLPRSHPWIQTILKNTPAADLPKAQLFKVVTYNGFSSSLSNMNFTFPAAEFVALVVLNVEPSVQEFVSYLAHSNNGNTAAYTGPYSAPAGKYGLEVAVVYPFGTVGRHTGTYTADGHIYNMTSTEAATGTAQNAAAAGLTAQYKWAFSTVSDDAYSINSYTFIRGLLNGVEQWRGIIEILAAKFRNKFGIGSNFEIIVDSETLSAAGGKSGSPQNMNEYINIFGQIDGRADAVEIISNNEMDQDIFISNFEIQPRWWKV